MRVLITTFGSFGDLYPYIALGAELLRRGHVVAIATSASHRARVEAEDLAFSAIRPDVDLNNEALLSYVMDAQHGSERVVRYLASVVRESYTDTLDAARQADAIVTHPVTFAAVLVAEKLGLRWISTVLAPLSFLSAYDPPVPPSAPWLNSLRILGPRFMKWFWNMGRKQTLPWVGPVLDLRRDLGLSRGKHPLFDGSHSPWAVLALFSRYLAPAQPDWPPNTVVTGFPFYDHGALPVQLQDFLTAGPSPVMFTLGSSAVNAAGTFYLDSLAAVRQLGCRAVFLTGAHPQGLPENLPAGTIAVPYAPHGAAFPHAAALVHQGGIGTTAQAMRSGRPQLVVPFAHDQFDNAARVCRLGAAEVLHRSHYRPRRVAQLLRQLLKQPSYASAAAGIGERVRTERGCESAAEIIERKLCG